jgi:uncharacterized protein (TIGR01777 family)
MISNNRVLITGGTGFIGTALRKYLESQGYEVGLMTRNLKPNTQNSFYWNPAFNEFDPAALKFADYILHLAGENIGAKRWTTLRKDQIVQSRIQAAECLAFHLRKGDVRPKKIISASAIGYYGQKTTQKIYTEDDPPGNDFVANTTMEWENTRLLFEELNIPVTRLRIGIVLSSQGGALPKMTLPVRFGLAAGLGSGKQYIPWISLRDLLHVFHFVLENDFPGEVFNAVSTRHIQSLDFNRILAKAMKKPFFLPNVPAFLLRLIFGEMAVLLLEGSRISADKLVRAGFLFEDNDLLQTMQNEYNKA